MFAVSPSVFVRISVVALYILVCSGVYWRLIPRLSPTAKWLASAMLAAQVLVIALSLELRLVSQLGWFFDLDKGYNVPTALAATQLVLASLIALASSGFGRAMPISRHILHVVLAAVLLFLAWVEFFVEHKRTYKPFGDWEFVYLALGAVLALAVVNVAWRSPKPVRIWCLSLMAGLAIAAAGALLVDLIVSAPCKRLGLYSESKCVLRTVEESLELLGCWVVVVAALGLFSDVAPAPGRPIRYAMLLLPLALFTSLMLYSFFVRGTLSWIERGIERQQRQWSLASEYRARAQPTAIQFGEGIVLQGMDLNHDGEAMRVLLFLSISQEQCPRLGFSIHLVDQDTSKSVASLDKLASCAHYIAFSGPDGSPIYRQSMTLSFPPQMPTNRALWILLSAWRARDDEYRLYPIASSDHKLLSETQVVLGELLLPGNSGVAIKEQLASFDHGLALGVVQLPAVARAGDTLSIPFSWRAETDGLEDYTQFLHFVHEELGGQWGYDQHPLGARLPTRLWYSGLVDTQVWRVPIPADLAPGTYQAFTGLYRSSDLKRLPARDATGKPLADARVALGVVTIERT